jgi:hypothetical protein
MSRALLLKGLQLIEDQNESQKSEKRGKKRAIDEKETSRGGQGSGESTMKWGLKQERRRLEREAKERRERRRVKCSGLETEAKKSGVEKLREKQRVDKTRDNVKVLKKLNRLQMQSQVTAQLLTTFGSEARRGRSMAQKPMERREKEKSVFTDEDFDKFVAEYVVE